MDVISYVVKTVIIGGVLYLVYRIYIYRIEKKKIEPPSEDEPEEPEPKDEFYLDLKKIADSFEFLYEELYSVVAKDQEKYSEKELNSLITEWEVKVKTNSKGAVQQDWSSLVKEHFNENWFADVAKTDVDTQKTFLKEWYEKLQGAGIKRDSRERITAEDHTLHHSYIINEIYNVGDELMVESPGWFLNGKCIEKGKAVKN